MNHQAEQRVGAVIANKWRIDALLGSGSMAAVYSATHRNGARAALKILHPTLCADTSVCERFLGEGYLTNSVKHPGIVRVLDDGVTDDGCVFLVMDLLEGVTLEARRQERGGQIGLAEIFDIGDKLMDVLRAVHDKGIIHRDLKPQNVFVCNDATVKLLDFGVARGYAGEQNKISVFGLVLGTPSFMSPEQALGARDDIDHRSDIWSLGATLFTAITGQTVHLGPNVQARLLAAASVKARSIQMAKPDLPAPLVAAIDTALRFERKERWQSVDAFQRSFREIRAQLGFGAAARPSEVVEDPTLPLVAMPAGRRPSTPPVTLPPAASARASLRGPNGTFVGIAALADGRANGKDARAKGGTMPMRPAPSFDDVLAAPVLPAQNTPPKPLSQGSRSSRPPTPPRPAASFGLDADDEAPLSFSKIDWESSYSMGRRPRLGVWLGAVFVLVVAASGVAFYSVDRGPHSDGTTGEREPITFAAGGSMPAAAPQAQTPVEPKAAASEPQAPSEPKVASASVTSEATANPHQPKVFYTPVAKANEPARVAPAIGAGHGDGDRPRPNVRPATDRAVAAEPTSDPTQAQRGTPNPAVGSPTAASAVGTASGKSEAPTTTLAPDPFGTPD